jgi:hypothetical protein
VEDPGRPSQRTRGYGCPSQRTRGYGCPSRPTRGYGCPSRPTRGCGVTTRGCGVTTHGYGATTRGCCRGRATHEAKVGARWASNALTQALISDQTLDQGPKLHPRQLQPPHQCPPFGQCSMHPRSYSPSKQVMPWALGVNIACHVFHFRNASSSRSVLGNSVSWARHALRIATCMLTGTEASQDNRKPTQRVSSEQNSLVQTKE